MRLIVYLFGVYIAAGIASGNETEAVSSDVQAATAELVLKPLGDSHVRALDSPIMFTCEVLNPTDDQDYQIKWIDKNDREIADTTGRIYVEEDGPAMKKLYITSIENSDAGKYMCSAVINGEQQTKSTKIVLYKKITFDSAPSPQTPKIYTDALITCIVSGSPEPQVSWRFNGKRLHLSSGPNGRYRTDENKHGMIITNITREDDGEYICRAEVNADGRYDEKKITVVVHIPPQITNSSGRVEGIEGGSTDITCVASGLPTAKYEFRKGGDLVQTNEHIIVDNDAGTVKFVKLRKADEGQYICKAYNDAGDDSVVGHLHVKVKPKIYELLNATETEGGSATLVCRSHGDPPPEMTFEKVGDSVEYMDGDNEDGRIVVTQSDVPGVLQMVINNLKPSDTGNYRCRSRSAIGDDSMVGTVTVNFAPKFAESQLNEVYTWAPRTSNISCKAYGSPSPTLQWLSKGHTLSDNDTFHIVGNGNSSYLQISVREPDQSWIYGSYVCRASNTLGSEDFNIELKRAFVPNSPAEVNTTKISPTTADLMVEAPLEDGGMPVVGYVVEYENTVLEFVIDQPVQLRNLKPNTTYTVLVRAKNDVGAGKTSEITFTTEPTRKPYAIVINSPERGSRPHEYKLSWNDPDTGGLPITKYRLKYRQVQEKTVNNTRKMEPVGEWKKIDQVDNERQPITHFDLKDLAPLTSYEVEIKAVNSIGTSDANKRFIFTTSEDPFATTVEPTAASTLKKSRGQKDFVDGRMQTDLPSDIVSKPETTFDYSMKDDSVLDPISEHSSPGGCLLDGLCDTDGSPAPNAVKGPDQLEAASISFGGIIGIVAAVMLVLLVVIDLSCCFLNKCGLTWKLCGKKSKSDVVVPDAEAGESKKLLKEPPTDDKAKQNTEAPSVDIAKQDKETPIYQNVEESNKEHGDETTEKPNCEEIPLTENVTHNHKSEDRQSETVG